jgi:hypothetical protein
MDYMHPFELPTFLRELPVVILKGMQPLGMDPCKAQINSPSGLHGGDCLSVYLLLI